MYVKQLEISKSTFGHIDVSKEEKSKDLMKNWKSQRLR